MKIIACYSNKGGVGKTATSVNLAYACAKKGLQTLLCDLDPQGASGFYFRIKPSRKLKQQSFFKDVDRLTKSIRESDYDNLDIIPSNMTFRDFDIFLSRMKRSRSRLKKVLKMLKSDYDVIVLDCPPNISRLSENVFKVADRIVVPVIPTTLSERTYIQLLDFFNENNLKKSKLIPFFSMVQRKKKLHKQTMARMRNSKFGFLDSVIPFSASIEKMGIHRAPVLTYARNSPPAQAYNKLWSELKETL